MSINRATLDGHLGADPEIRTTNSGGRVATFRLATTEKWKDRATGEQKERTMWHSVVVFADWLVDVVEKKLKKGRAGLGRRLD
jgi:single-strand DNA-binding protein